MAQWLNVPTRGPRAGLYPSGSVDSRKAAVDNNASLRTQGHADKIQGRETDNFLGVAPIGEFIACAGYSMAKGYCKPSAKGTKSRATEKLGRVEEFWLTLVARKFAHSLLRKNLMIDKEVFTRYSWL